jgi:hypothetical protein
MPKYQVLNNDKPADCNNFKVHDSWVESKFDTFEKAHDYALKWLGGYNTGIVLQLNVPFDFTGCGDTIIIKEIESDEVVSAPVVARDAGRDFVGDHLASAVLKFKAHEDLCNEHQVLGQFKEHVLERLRLLENLYELAGAAAIEDFKRSGWYIDPTNFIGREQGWVRVQDSKRVFRNSTYPGGSITWDHEPVWYMD